MKRKLLFSVAAMMISNTTFPIIASDGIYTIKHEIRNEEQVLQTEVKLEELESVNELEEQLEKLEIVGELDENLGKQLEEVEKFEQLNENLTNFNLNKEVRSTVLPIEEEKVVTIWKTKNNTTSAFNGMIEGNAKIITKTDGEKLVKLTINRNIMGTILTDFEYSFDNENFEQIEITQDNQEIEIKIPNEYLLQEDYCIYFGASYTVGSYTGHEVARVIVGNTDKFKIGTEKDVTIWKLNDDSNSAFTGMVNGSAFIMKYDNESTIKLTINRVVMGTTLTNFKYSFDNENFEQIEITQDNQEIEIKIPDEYLSQEDYCIYFGASYTVGSYTGSEIARVIIGNVENFTTSTNGDNSFGGSVSGAGSQISNEIADGKYTVDIYFYNANSNALSMADNVLNRTAIIDANNGEYTLSFSTKPMSIGNITDVLREFKYLKNGSYVDATVIAYNNNIGDETNLPSAFSFVLPSLDEYISVKVNHPQVAGLGSDLIDVRLKIDWSTLSRNSSAVLSTDTTTYVEKTESFSFEDSETGIKIEGPSSSIEPSSEFIVNLIKDTDNYAEIAKILDEEVLYIMAYEIKLLKDQEEVSPKGTLKISIPVPQYFNSDEISIYRINSDGTKTVIKATIQDDMLIFETSDIGTFVIVQSGKIEELEQELQESEEITTISKLENPFIDISQHWAKDSINFVLENNIFIGIDEDHFAPDAGMTRAMLVEVIARIENIDKTQYKYFTSYFEDIKNNSYYFEAVIWANQVGIISGISENEFAPDKVITREEAITIFNRYLEYTGVDIQKIYRGFTFNDDSEISSWAKDEVYNLVEAGIIVGADGNFLPKASVTRAEIAVIIEKILKGYFGY